ncbi:MAG: hypothetical protein ACI9AD_001785 [Nitriliruptoraceae bacterium]|jgi:hypothetical protein
MRKLLIVLFVATVALLIGTQLGWRFTLAPLLGLSIWAWATATMRSFLNHGQTGVAAVSDVEVLEPEDRTMFWCEECGTEVLLLVRGSGIPPRHCATRMHERAEISS